MLRNAVISVFWEVQIQTSEMGAAVELAGLALPAARLQI